MTPPPAPRREKLRILYHHRTASKDGQAVHIAELIHAIRGLGHDVEVVEPGVSAGASFGGEPRLLAHLRRRLPKALRELLELAYNVKIYLRLRSACRRFRPHVLYERHHLYLLAGAWLKRRYGIPCLLEVNSPLFAERSAEGALAFSTIARSTERWVWRQADVLLPVSRVLAGIIEQSGVPAERMAVIPNGIDPQRFEGYPPLVEAKRRLGLEDRLVLGFTGFVREWNALDRVIRYLARPGNEKCVLLLVGDGPARPALETLAASLGVTERVRIEGVVGRDRIRDYVAAFDVALQPAANSYASPLKLFEYLAMGRAVVAPAQPNLMEIVQDGVDALLFDPKEPEALEGALDRVTSDDSLRRELGRNAAALIERRKYTWENNARRVTEIAERLCARTPMQADAGGAIGESRPTPLATPGRSGA